MSVPVSGYHKAFLNALTDSGASGTSTRGDRADLFYINFIEQRIQEAEPEMFSIALGSSPMTRPGPGHPSRIFELMRDVATCMGSTHQFSIQDALKYCKGKGYFSGQLSQVRLEMFTRVVFIVCGWITMLYSPDVKWHGNSKYLCIDREETKSYGLSSQALEKSQRPLVELIRGLGEILPTADWEIRTPRQVYPIHDHKRRIAEADVLVSHLNVYTLCRLGSVGIVWTYSIGSHLLFDRLDRKLFLFCLPSFCKINMVGQTPYARIYNEYYDSPIEQGQHPESFLEEVLLSYRLLFRDEKASRKLYRHVERPKVLSKLGLDKEPILDALCGFDVTESLFAEITSPLRVSYSTSTDFPILGTRLLDLQSFAAAQRPSRLASLWRDRRDALTWYTFWTVLGFGVVSVMCSIAQVILAGIQVHYARKSLQAG